MLETYTGVRGVPLSPQLSAQYNASSIPRKTSASTPASVPAPSAPQKPLSRSPGLHAARLALWHLEEQASSKCPFPREVSAGSDRRLQEDILKLRASWAGPLQLAPLGAELERKDSDHRLSGRPARVLQEFVGSSRRPQVLLPCTAPDLGRWKSLDLPGEGTWS